MKSDFIGHLRIICRSSYIFTDDFASRKAESHELCYVVGVRADKYIKSQKNFYVKVLTKTGIGEVYASQLFENINDNEP